LDWTKENGESYAELDELYGAYRTILEDIWDMLLKCGGIYDSPKHMT
jgi:hypothetical protein